MTIGRLKRYKQLYVAKSCLKILKVNIANKKLPVLRRTAFAIKSLIKTRVKSVEILRVKRVGDEPQDFAEMINLSKCQQSLY